jgi:hypothetical protein
MFANPQSFAINVSVSALSASESPQPNLKLQEEYVLTAGTSSDSHMNNGLRVVIALASVDRRCS